MPSSWFNLVSVILFESALLAGVDLTDLLMEQPQLNKFHLPQMQLGGICLAKQMTSYMRGKSQQPHGVILLFVSLCKFNSQVPMERPTFGMVMICVTVLSLSIIAALACVAAEFKRTKVRLREREREASILRCLLMHLLFYQWHYSCGDVYLICRIGFLKVEDIKLDSKLCRLPGSPSFGLGVVASICLLAAQIIGSSAFSCQFCSRQKELGIHAKRKTTAITLLLLSW